MKEISKKEIILYSLLLILFIIQRLHLSFIFCDLIWHYNNASIISDGLVMYKDFGCITTPLFYYLSSIPLFFTKNPNAFFLFNGIFIIIMFITLLSLSFTFTENKIKRLSYTLIFAFLLTKFSNDYNFMVSLFNFLGIKLILKMQNPEKNNNKNMILLGIIAFLMFLSKQTLGIVFSLEFIIIYIIITHKNFKFKKLFPFFITIAIAICSFIIFLVVNNNLMNFVDFAILGVTKFSNKISILQYIQTHGIKHNLYLLFIFVILIVNIIYVIKRKETIAIVLLVINIFNLINLYPIVNIGHLCFVYISYILTICYFIGKTPDIIINNKQNYNFLLNIVILIFVVVIIALPFYFSSNESEINGIKISDESYDITKDIYDYQVKHPENIYYSPEDCYVLVETVFNRPVTHKYLNEFLIGNIGQKDYTEVITDLENTGTNNYIYIYKSDEDRLWQTPTNPIEYIKENYKKIDSTEYFDIYKIP